MYALSLQVHFQPVIKMTEKNESKTKMKSYQFNHQNIQGWNDCPALLCSESKPNRKIRRPKRVSSYVSFLNPATNDTLSVGTKHLHPLKLEISTPPPFTKCDIQASTSNSVTQNDKKGSEYIKIELAQLFTLKTRLTEKEMCLFKKQIGESNIFQDEVSKRAALSFINDFKRHLDITHIGEDILEFRQHHSDAIWCLPLWKVLQSAEIES